MLKWILGLIVESVFKHLFGFLNDKAKEKAERERDAAVIAATTAQESGDLALEIAQKQAEVERVFKAKGEAGVDPADPFGFKGWNES